MPMVQATLASGLLSLSTNPSTDQVSANNALADVFHNFMATSDSMGIPLDPSIGALGRTAFFAALSPMAPGAPGPLIIQTAVIAYWASIAIPLAYGPLCLSLTPPPLIATLAAVLTPVFLANTVPGITAEVATNAIAAAWYATNLGGIAIQNVPPIPTPTPFPIL